MCESNITCEITEEIRRKYDLANIRDIPAFVDNLVDEAEWLKNRLDATKHIIATIRKQLDLDDGDSILETVAILKRDK